MPTINQFDPLLTYTNGQTLKHLFKNNYTKVNPQKTTLPERSWLNSEFSPERMIESPLLPKPHIQLPSITGKNHNPTNPRGYQGSPQQGPYTKPLTATLGGRASTINDKKTTYRSNGRLNYLFTGDHQGNLKQWSVNSKKMVKDYGKIHNAAISCIVMSDLPSEGTILV